MNVVEGQVYVMYISNWSQSGLAFNLTFNPASTASLDCTVLPLGLLDLTATPYGDGVELRWHSGTEAQASHFVVERSADGAAFEALGSDAANAAQAELGHRLLDPAPFLGVNHYRVLEVGLDGSMKRSPTAVIHLGVARATVVPNPSGDRATLRSADELPAGTTLWLVDATGRRVRSLVTTTTTQQVSLELQGLEAGSYLILIELPSGAAKAPVRFIKN